MNKNRRAYDPRGIHGPHIDAIISDIVEVAKEELFMSDHKEEVFEFMGEKYPEELMGLIRDIGSRDGGAFSIDQKTRIDWDIRIREANEERLLDKLTKKYKPEIMVFLKDKYPEEFI